MIESWKTHFRKTLALATPVMISQAGQVTVNVADSTMVGQLGKTELASVSLGNAVFFGFLVGAIGFSFAMSPLIAEADAKNNKERVSTIFSHGLILNFLISIGLAIFVWLLLPIIHHPILGQPKEVVKLAIPYIEISLISMIPIMIFQSVRQLSEGLSLTLPVTIATITGNIINIGLNYGLIYGNWGMPRMEVEGAALGSLITRFAMIFILVLVLLFWKKAKQYLTSLSFKNIQKKVLSNVSKLGFPTALQLFFEVSAFSAAAFICGMSSEEDLAAHQIAINLASITFLLCTGIAVASTIRIGNQLGMKNYENLKKVGWNAIFMSIVFMFVCGIVFILFRNIFPTFYLDNDNINNTLVLEIASSLLIVAAVFQLADGIQVVALGTLRGMQDVNIPTIITFIAYWVITLPLAYYLSQILEMGALGVWIALGLGLIISAICLMFRFRYISNLISNQINPENEIDSIGN